MRPEDIGNHELGTMRQVFRGTIEMRFWWLIPGLIGCSRSNVNEDALVFAIHITPFFEVGVNWKYKKGGSYVNMSGKILSNVGLEYIKSPEGIEYWHKDGKFDRLGGPAIKTPEGYESWFEGGARHRLDGPAVKYSDGRTEYWANGKKVKPFTGTYDVNQIKQEVLNDLS